jgi:hypothetical protein
MYILYINIIIFVYIGKAKGFIHVWGFKKRILRFFPPLIFINNNYIGQIKKRKNE